VLAWALDAMQVMADKQNKQVLILAVGITLVLLILYFTIYR
jgi:hypothetical protein